MKYLRYYREFYSADDTLYRIELHQESDTAYTPIEVELGAETVLIEWGEVDKLEPVRGSSATLSLLSTTDRQFYDMFAVAYGEIDLIVYRNGAVYWRGTLDPELFSEPYAFADNYLMELSFVDFAALDHLYWDMEGLVSIEQVINRCLAAISLDGHSIRKYISTSATLSDGTEIDPLGAYIAAENFYDEDSEPMTLREVLEEVLKPFALQIVQKNGEVIIYDLNALAEQQPEQVTWHTNDQTLEADKIYNDVTVKFSPYTDQVILKAEIEEDDELPDETNFAICAGYSDQAITNFWMPSDSVPPIGSTDPNSQYIECYQLFYSSQGGTVGNFTAKNGAVFFRILPVYSGNAEKGVLFGFSMGALSGGAGGDSVWKPNATAGSADNFFANPAKRDANPIISFPRFYAAADESSRPNQLRLSLEMMFDARTNPFEDADFFKDDPDQSAYDTLIEAGVYCYVPIRVFRCDADGTRTHEYWNAQTLGSTAAQSIVNGWHTVDYNPVNQWPCYLCYYEEKREKGVMSGWVKNKRIVGKKTGSLTEAFKRKNNGEYIPLPPVSGYIEIEIYPGVLFYSKDRNQRPSTREIYRPEHGMYAFKTFEVASVPSYGKDEVEATDVEDIAWINRAARENLDFDNIVGTVRTAAPTARGVLRSASGEQIVEFTRGAHTDRLERLLIGTAYSQFSARKNILAGTVELLPSFAAHSDEAIGGRYVIVSEVQSLTDATSEIRMIEFIADDYQYIEEKKKNERI